jgi:predicted polyphosphate/ATP-dependent NAD kinase
MSVRRTLARRDVVVGIVANPASGRDIRRLVASASVFPTAEKTNMVQRMLSTLGYLGVGQVLLNTDLAGISAGVLQRLRQRRPAHDPSWPAVHFLDQDPITDSAADTVNAVRRMNAAGAAVIVCLGGDGTMRVAASACGDTPLLALSTGTNNAFPQMREATIAGLAAGLVATEAVDVEEVITRASVLDVHAGERCEPALVDVALSGSLHVGARALWDPGLVTWLLCTFAEPDAIGMSSIAGQLCPSSRSEAGGVALRLGPADDCPYVVHAAVAPGVVAATGVREWWRLSPDEAVDLGSPNGVLAVDGEREIELTGTAPVSVRLRAGGGPRCIDVGAVLAESAREGVLREDMSNLSANGDRMVTSLGGNR